MHAKRSTTEFRPANEGVRRLLIAGMVVLAIAALVFLAAVVLLQSSRLPSDGSRLPATAGGPRPGQASPGSAPPPSPGEASGPASRGGQVSLTGYPPGEPPGDLEDEDPRPGRSAASSSIPLPTVPAAPLLSIPGQPLAPFLAPTVPAPATLPLPLPAPSVAPRPLPIATPLPTPRPCLYKACPTPSPSP
jgi:hypothetical protein